MDLLLEIKILIAAFDQETWVKLVMYDNSFHKYAYTIYGRKQFIDLFTVLTINNVYTVYKLFGKRHRDDGPAAIYAYGAQCWYQNGKLHRDDLPAIIYPNGTRYWYQNGKLHRNHGPAIIHSNGEHYWYQNGKLHNT